MLKKYIITTLFFILFLTVTVLSLEHPIIGDVENGEWVMNITVISSGATYTITASNIVNNSTTTHIETIIFSTRTEVYTIMHTRPQINKITTQMTVHSPTTLTITNNSQTTVTTTNKTHIGTVVIVHPTKRQIITMTSKLVVVDWRSAVIWASIVYDDKTIIGYTTYFYR